MLSRLKRSIERSYSLRFVYWLFVLNFFDLASRHLLVSPKPNEKKRVVFVRLDGIGDYVLWSHTFDSLDEIYPRAEWERISVGNSLWKDIANRERFFDTRIFFDPKRAMRSPLYRFRYFRSIRALNADVIINPRLTREFILMDSIVRVSGARERIGSEGIANRMTGLQANIANSWYTKLVRSPDRKDHELESNFRFLEGLRKGGGQAMKLRPFPSQEIKSFVNGAYAVIFPGAQQGDKMWPVEKFAAAAVHLADKHSLKIVICGGPSDRPLAEQFKNAFAGKCEDLVGKISLSEMSDVIAKARILITNDTGAGHIGVAAGCPTVVITPGNHVGRFFPYPDHLGLPQLSVVHEMPCFGCDWQCIFNRIPPGLPKPCVADVRVADVIAALDVLLSSVRVVRVSEQMEKTLT